MELGLGQGADGGAAGVSTCAAAGSAAPAPAPPPTPPPPPPSPSPSPRAPELPPPDQLDRVLRRLVQRKRGMFHCFPDIGEEDLLQECRMAVPRAWHRFDPARSTWPTFAYLVASRRVIDLHRNRTRQAHRDAVQAAMRDVEEWVDAGDSAGLPGGLGDRTDRTAAEWLADVYRQVRRRFPGRRRGKRGRAWFSPAQVITVALWMRRKSLSVRGARAVLLADAELRRAIGLRHVPHASWFGRAEKFATDNLRPRPGRRPR